MSNKTHINVSKMIRINVSKMIRINVSNINILNIEPIFPFFYVLLFSSKFFYLFLRT